MQKRAWLRASSAGLAVLLAGLLSAAAQAPPAASGGAALEHVTVLSQQIGTRVAGSATFGRAADYVTAQLLRLGYRVERQGFPFVGFEETSPPTLAVTAPEQATLHPVTLLYSGPTPSRGLETEIVAAGIGRRDDFASKRVEGRIVLVERGELRFYEKASNAAAAGAAAVIIYNSQSGPAQGGTLGLPTAIPTVMISQDEGRQLLHWLEAGSVRVRLTVNSMVETRRGENVLGIKAGTTAPDEIVVVGAHLDTVPGVPGANDNASGIAAMLETARLLAGVPVARTLHFVAFGAEEVGLLGSDYYVRNHRGTVVGMINLDMVGNGLVLLIATSSGGGELLDVAARVAGRLGIPIDRSRVGNSDHVSFERAGVPVIFIHTGDDGVYHTPLDVVARINPQLLAAAASLAAGVVEEIAAGKH